MLPTRDWKTRFRGLGVLLTLFGWTKGPVGAWESTGNGCIISALCNKPHSTAIYREYCPPNCELHFIITPQWG